MFNTKALVIGALSAVTLFSFADSAHAMNFKVTKGVVGANGETNEGMYSEFHNKKGFTTVDFNSTPTEGGFGVQGKTDAEGVGLLTSLGAEDAAINYSYTGEGSSNVRADMWGPAGWDGQTTQYNSSNYSAIFDGKDLEIKMNGLFNYFGVNWGAAHTANRYSFYKGDKLIAGYTYDETYEKDGIKFTNVADIFREQGAYADWQGQDNAYVHMYAENADQTFDRLVISQYGGGGFETDNHSFHAGDKGFDFEKGATAVPEPGVVAGLLVVGGGMFLRKRRQQKSLNLE